MEWIYPKLGRMIREIRIAKHLSQKDLGQRIGLTRTSVVNIEQGRQKILLHTLYALAEALDVPPAELLPSIPNSENGALGEVLVQTDPVVASFYAAVQRILREQGES